MTPGSLPPLSPKARALLSAEREILPRPELQRRRAALRARTVLWHARGSAELPRARSAVAAWWKRASLAAVAFLGATSAFAAWMAFEPAGSPDDRAPGVASAPRPPGVGWTPAGTPAEERAGLRSSSVPPAPASNSSPLPAGALAEPGERVRTARETPGAAKPTGAPASGTPVSVSKPGRVRNSSTSNPVTSSEELALLDRARRAVGAGDFRAALQVIDKHARAFPKSQLREEREALRVRALAGAGLAKRAGQAARDFESSYPNSVLVPDLRSGDRTAP